MQCTNATSRPPRHGNSTDYSCSLNKVGQKAKRIIIRSGDYLRASRTSTKCEAQGSRRIVLVLRSKIPASVMPKVRACR